MTNQPEQAWRHEPWDNEITLFRRRPDGTEQGLYGWAEISAYMTALERKAGAAEELEGYAQHKDGCPLPWIESNETIITGQGEPACTCGLNQALATYHASQGGV